MPRIKPYSLEFRQEAVRLLRTSGRSIPQLADELGVSPQSLRNRSRQLALDEGKAPGLTSDEREELRRLRREVRVLAEEREILKTAAVSSSRQRNGTVDVGDHGAWMARSRRGYSSGERRDLWARWVRGESISGIARALDRAPGTIHCTVKERGGIAPATRRRRSSALTMAEREEISRGIAAGASVRRIAWGLGRAPSTISREITRNGGRDCYRGASAERRAGEAGRRPQRCKLSVDDVLRDLVAGKLAEDWSPEQISGWLEMTYYRGLLNGLWWLVVVVMLRCELMWRSWK